MGVESGLVGLSQVSSIGVGLSRVEARSGNETLVSVVSVS